MNPLENPFSRRVWKNWARNKCNLHRNQPAQPKLEKVEIEANDTTPAGIYLMVLIALLFGVFIAGAVFWYLISTY